MRTIIIGDVHGCIDELLELLNKTKYAPGDDRLIFLGDLVDRGPDSAAVVKLVRELKAECLMGNHEEKHLRYRRHEARVATQPGYVNPMKPYNEKRLAEYHSLRDEDWNFLEKLPYFIRLDSHMALVHAGAMPSISLEHQKPNHLMRLRYINKATGKMVSLNEINSIIDPDEMIRNYDFWADIWTGPEILIYGHNAYPEVRHSLRVLWDACDVTDSTIKSGVGIRAIGIDTGCCFGWKLTALVMTPGCRIDIVSVPARREYHPYRAWRRKVTEEEDCDEVSGVD